MLTVCFIEDNENIAFASARLIDELRAAPGGALLLGNMPLVRRADIIVLSPSSCGRKTELPPSCGALLSPGGYGADRIKTDSVVSYGMSARDSLTYSSVKRGICTVAVMRELETFSGAVVERQEIPALIPEGVSEEGALAVFGCLLLLGAPPEKLEFIPRP